MSCRFPISRRQLLGAGGGALLGASSAAAWAQGGRAVSPRAPLVIAQIFDTSAAQQDVSKDFLVGSRAAWQEINTRGGVQGRPVQHLSIEVDGSAASLQAALASIRDNPACVCLSGTAGDPVSTRLVGMLRQETLAIAHVAPWLQNSALEIDDRTFPIFAARQEQIGHALKSLALMGVRELGAIYASPREQALYQQDLERIAVGFEVRLQSFRAEGDLVRLGQRLTPSTPAILLFVGGTPELVQFTQGLDKQARQRYVVALADVNLQTLTQMGASRATPVIATQPVPMVNASLPVVRLYRETLGRLFDEPPTPLSLAGFIAARYTFGVLADMDGNLSRHGVLAAFQRRGAVDVGGYRVAFDAQRRSATYVTQSMLTVDGRVVG